MRAHEGGDAPTLVQPVLDSFLIPLAQVSLAVLLVVAPEVGAQEDDEDERDQHVGDPQERHMRGGGGGTGGSGSDVAARGRHGQ